MRVTRRLVGGWRRHGSRWQSGFDRVDGQTEVRKYGDGFLRITHLRCRLTLVEPRFLALAEFRSEHLLRTAFAVPVD